MNIWKRGNFLVLIFLSVFLLSGCSKLKEESQFITVEIPEDTTKLYYLNEEQNKVISKSISLEKIQLEEQVAELLTVLEETIWTTEEKKLVSNSNPIQGFIFNEETGGLTLYFASDYYVTHTLTEVLRRAAIVKTLCQIKKVTSVEIYIGSQPLMLSNGKPVGMMKEEDFIESTGANAEFFQEIIVSIYFANETGELLVESNLKISYDGTVSTERLILNQLIEGPVSSNVQAVIPEGTVLNKVSVKDGICYVDFSEEFMNIREGILPEVAIYSVVNSLTELSNVYRVQFLIDGVPRKTYENIEFSSYFERNLDIMEGEQ